MGGRTNDQGQLGDGTVDERWVPGPISMASDRPHFDDIAAGTGHTCGVTVGEVAWCWGGNAYGQLGNGTNAPSLRPTAVKNR